MTDNCRIFLVSNRLPLTIEINDGQTNFKRSSGGLVSGLKDIHSQENALWVGHAGIFSDDPKFDAVREKLRFQRYLSVPIKNVDYQNYYRNIANGILWPLFHYFPSYMKYNSLSWQSYEKVNQDFADAILAEIQPGDKVWIHDYQLMLLPALLRKREPNLSIAYFHHIPFPSSEIFRILPTRQMILQGLLGADLIGFHTLDYARHFLTCVTRLLGGEADKDRILYQRRCIQVGAFPLGIDVNSLHNSIKSPETVPGMETLASSLHNKKVFLGIDRLDYTKGIPERLRAYQCFLKSNPHYQGQVVLVQVCVPSREDTPNYAELRVEIERLVGNINGEFGQPGYVPIQYLYQPFSPEQVNAFYKLGHVALVTPLRDGLNLVCKEFVASRCDHDGVLILSEFAGAAAEMGEALLVNPYDVECIADNMRQALEMPLAEQKQRMERLRSRVFSYNNLTWSKDFISAWNEAMISTPSAAIRLDSQVKQSILENVLHQPKKILFLDYDGTLTPIQKTPVQALPSLRLIKILKDLGRRFDTELFIITGRPRAFCDAYFSDLGIHLIAEHGAFEKRKQGETWQRNASETEFTQIKDLVNSHLQSFIQRIPGSFIEEKETALVLHYRLSEPIFARSQALDLKESLVQILSHTSYSVFKAKKALEIKPATANKAAVVEKILNEWRLNDSYFITAGDDAGDEEMFRIHADYNISIHCGQNNTNAKYFADSDADIVHLLEEITQFPEHFSYFRKISAKRG